ncbi:MAG: hypothetical protein NXY57DRAFT_990807 [Lentinula lateritia]|uniref:C2H2-type domain-containing protein n=1 Tax=Lentinula lateritia TaxID=40482 RepID=A0ABQ8VJ10_9AGAR|nr:MAG: hypothetical protein NXY57DRAFT_990807 [Lentinula lateritia]KAJ4495630.1 hypothetical protein C8R41DRAFT_827408 [Lentinula lateritia]
MMEVDMQSPSSSLRPAYGSSKRARSPDETNSPSRPSKRLTLATGIEYNPSQPIYLRSSSSAGSSRQPSEDWVQQAGSLTIDSPLCTKASESSPFEDYAMAADQPVQNPSTAVPLTATYGRPQLPPLQTSFSRPSDVRPDYATATQALPQRGTTNDSNCQHLAPSINVLPPTPNVSFPMAFSLAARPSTPMNESPMSIPNSPSSATILSPSRKHRFAMGPRADCEKCIRGVKGHYIHIG